MPPLFTPEDMLETLVGFPTVAGTSNQELMTFVADYLGQHGARVHRLPGPQAGRENLFATLGDPSRPGYVLSGHVDVVPAGEPEWRADPFRLRRENDRLIGRGACDMKGFDAAVLAAVPALAAMDLSVPIHIALSYDEELGCKGVPHMIARLPDLCAPAAGAIIGEPSGMQPVLAHKGKAALALTATGVPGHSSRPDLGRNAIHALLPALSAVATLADTLQSGARDARFAPPYSTVQIGTVSGGQSVNIIPDNATCQIESRAIAGVDPRALLSPVLDSLPEDVSATWLSSYPGLGLATDHPLATLTASLSGQPPVGAVSYGTEAGLFQQAGIPAIICGPGDIGRAHKPEEYLTRAELAAAHRFILDLGRQLCR